VRDFVVYASVSGNGYFIVAANMSSVESKVQAHARCAKGPGIVAGAAGVRGRSAEERERLDTIRREWAAEG